MVMARVGTKLPRRRSGFSSRALSGELMAPESVEARLTPTHQGRFAQRNFRSRSFRDDAVGPRDHLISVGDTGFKSVREKPGPVLWWLGTVALTRQGSISALTPPRGTRSV